jgi:hypothetical protein
MVMLLNPVVPLWPVREKVSWVVWADWLMDSCAFEICEADMFPAVVSVSDVALPTVTCMVTEGGDVGFGVGAGVGLEVVVAVGAGFGVFVGAAVGVGEGLGLGVGAGNSGEPINAKSFSNEAA